MDTSKRLPAEREDIFPNLVSTGYDVTSPEDTQYNCIAWAEGDQSRFWTPFAMGGGYYWPVELPKKADVETFVKLYELKGGFTVCRDESLEDGIEKIAIYADPDGQVTHAARQKADGIWTSKLGDWEDIDHKTVGGLAGPEPAYGTPVKFMKRARTKSVVTP